jgi:hypothetical protein
MECAPFPPTIASIVIFLKLQREKLGLPSLRVSVFIHERNEFQFSISRTKYQTSPVAGQASLFPRLNEVL